MYPASKTTATTQKALGLLWVWYVVWGLLKLCTLTVPTKLDSDKQGQLLLTCARRCEQL